MERMNVNRVLDARAAGAWEATAYSVVLSARGTMYTRLANMDAT